MIVVGDIALLRPWALLALPLVIFLGWYLGKHARGLGDWSAKLSPQMAATLTELGWITGGHTRWLGPPLLWCAAILGLAMAGPAMERRGAQSFRNLDGVVFVIDLSQSTTESPDWPRAITFAREAAEGLGSKPAALIVYAGDAYTALEMTTDARQIGLTISLLEGGLIPDPGSRPATGLAAAADVLKEAEILAGDVVLITDGDGLDKAGAARDSLAALGAALHVGVVPGDADLAGFNTYALNEGGRLADTLRVSGSGRMARRDQVLLFWEDYGRWLILFALIPALLRFRGGVA